ncbi:hypothetical protein D187_003587 [Cystobacter fuscus DSM 2262]|uniref:Uncharacterized protein n=1 Tax=Cystobacter fuscus (strain ATCC 25194 / DSM 2262 / NBRC 100088 / M29) TaxID=1242864 RepID=S9P9B4_CYSF2|nr:hypothetical protein D187_003587 [Cystobacter fuscus DSM 2262]
MRAGRADCLPTPRFPMMLRARPGPWAGMGGGCRVDSVFQPSEGA